MKFDGWQTSYGYNGDALDYWIRYRKNEPIPDELKYKDEISDWVKNHPGEEILGKFHVESSIYDWIKYHKGEPIPDELMIDDWEHFTDPK